MRKILVSLSALAAIAILSITQVFAATNVPLDGLMVGTDTAHNLVGWGPEEPFTHPGGWGGAPAGSAYCRVMWAGGEPDNPEGRSATATLDGKGSARIIRITHLNGHADDSFDVYAQREGEPWIFIGHYSWVDLGAEVWLTTDFDLYAAFSAADIGVGLGKPLTVKLAATAPAWPWQHIYGQVAIREIVLIGNGLPGY